MRVRAVAAAFVIGVARTRRGAVSPAALRTQVHRAERWINHIHAGAIRSVGQAGGPFAGALAVAKRHHAGRGGDGTVRSVEGRNPARCPGVTQILIVVTVATEVTGQPWYLDTARRRVRKRFVHVIHLLRPKLRAEIHLHVLHVGKNQVGPANARFACHWRQGMTRKTPAVVVAVKLQAQSELSQIAQTADGLGLDLGPGQRRQKHACQNRDDGDDHQQLNQCEAAGVVCPTGKPATCRTQFHGADSNECRVCPLPVACVSLSAACGVGGTLICV